MSHKSTHLIDLVSPCSAKGENCPQKTCSILIHNLAKAVQSLTVRLQLHSDRKIVMSDRVKPCPRN